MEALTKLAGWLIVITLSTLLFGWVATVVWGWYVVPAFGAAALKYKTAIGVSYLFDLQFMGIALSTDDDFRKHPAGVKIFLIMFMYLIVLALAGTFFVVLP